MSRTFYLFARGVMLLALCAPGFGQAQTPSPEKRTDYASGDYDNREELVTSYAAIREFLRQNNVLTTD